jgi:hypothetical protein
MGACTYLNLPLQKVSRLSVLGIDPNFSVPTQRAASKQQDIEYQTNLPIVCHVQLYANSGIPFINTKLTTILRRERSNTHPMGIKELARQCCAQLDSISRPNRLHAQLRKVMALGYDGSDSDLCTPSIRAVCYVGDKSRRHSSASNVSVSGVNATM